MGGFLKLYWLYFLFIVASDWTGKYRTDDRNTPGHRTLQHEVTNSSNLTLELFWQEAVIFWQQREIFMTVITGWVPTSSKTPKLAAGS